jgi:F-box protein 18 (helicase)
MDLTAEQQEILGAHDHRILIKAFAGTGKTTTLAAYARANPRERMVYLAFNRAIKEEASSKFPSNVRCVTTHGLAFPSFGKMYQPKLGSPRAYQVASRLKLPLQPAGMALEAVSRFLVSADLAFQEQHFQGVPVGQVTAIREHAEKIWSIMQDVQDASIPMPHDGYLKLYQLSNPTIPADRILFDECQDANAVTLAIVNRQACAQMYVGDENQAIYGFRGAVNAMNKIHVDRQLALTHSFRFGSGIADVANALLGAFYPHPTPIVGCGDHETRFSVDVDAPHAILSRTNGMLFGESVNALMREVPFGFVGGVANYQFENILDAHLLQVGQHDKIKDRLIKSFGDFEEMKAYGEALDDKEIKSLVRIVDNYGREIPVLIERIKTVAVKELTGNEITLTTAHKAKGMEWMDVVLTDDFTDMEVRRDKGGKETVPDREEINLLYVADTRAMRGIQLPGALVAWLREQRPSLIRQLEAKAIPSDQPLVVQTERKTGKASLDTKKQADRASVLQGILNEVTDGLNEPEFSPLEFAEAANLMLETFKRRIPAISIPEEERRQILIVMSMLEHVAVFLGKDSATIAVAERDEHKRRAEKTISTPRNGQRWTESEENNVLGAWMGKESIHAIAKRAGRTAEAVACRIASLTNTEVENIWKLNEARC